MSVIVGKKFIWYPLGAGMGVSMNEEAWLCCWCQEHIQITHYDDEYQAKDLARQAMNDAAKEDIAIEEAIYGYASLESYMLDAVNACIDDHIKNK